ncbi:hypothetical protein Anas_07949 [Armadillidium nasatum]|uniref:Uncharacterized protein n=1 Tax=Armadillidium nasatum TaxID=96803 RepID=A0A5N5SQQ0_9CRUS|nr:hypothetical protein Anas_07949 [Armadillidium nasatum]
MHDKILQIDGAVINLLNRGVQPTKLVLPANVGYCDDLSFSADGNQGIAYEPLCGDLSDKTLN